MKELFFNNKKLKNVTVLVEGNSFGDQIITAYYNRPDHSSFVIFTQLNHEGQHETNMKALERQIVKSIPKVILPVGKMNWTV